jgi:hypothetical protein
VCAENGLDPMDVLITAQTGAGGGHAVSMDEQRAHALAHELHEMQQQAQQQQLYMRDLSEAQARMDAGNLPSEVIRLLFCWSALQARSNDMCGVLTMLFAGVLAKLHAAVAVLVASFRRRCRPAGKVVQVCAVSSDLRNESKKKKCVLVGKKKSGNPGRRARLSVCSHNMDDVSRDLYIHARTHTHTHIHRQQEICASRGLLVSLVSGAIASGARGGGVDGRRREGGGGGG